MQSFRSPWYGILTILLLSLVLMNWLTCTQDLSQAMLVSLAFFVTSTGILLAIHKHRSKLAPEKLLVPSIETMQIAVLKEQLRGCLQYGDTEKADEISQKLVALTGSGQNEAINS
jgi:MFS superfamily sulfate permease-like transporter